MAVRVVGGALVGAVVAFMWGFVFWTVLPFSDQAITRVADEGALSESLRQHVGASGAYALPYPDHHEGMTAEQKKMADTIWKGKHEMGPVALLFYSQDGVSTEDPLTFARGFLIALLASFLLAAVSAAAAQRGVPYGRRVALILSIALFAALTSHAMQWNWFYLPMRYSITMFAELVVGWTLAGLAIAAIAQPGRPKSPPKPVGRPKGEESAS
ncbi:MAG: hypothetical protein DYG93_09215 [Leptolyngbya sp. PLA2]|nr:hypothetical protein [Leptolyngbya sp.]MCE7971826.1 hypothetical protein [Leptolyngbya sp. PL-A2]MCZ7634467.1 hypothetical protein [Phycisphaerales bacterium]MDL1904735.1 hypothetical protein [Synechococcales cyanobacterium CNB]GIK19783.1 MAG: hypothetical protein BroJett004_19470 [Planctomycetota bacterium]